MTVNGEQCLGFRVEGLEVAIAERPRGRDAVVMSDFAEITFTQAEQSSTVNFRVAADIIVESGMERLTFVAVPCFGRLVGPVDENGLRVPVCAGAGR